MAEPRKVKSVSKMDTETFLKHMNRSHIGAFGMTSFGTSNVPGDEDEHLLRAAHDLDHQQRGDALDHIHGKDD